MKALSFADIMDAASKDTMNATSDWIISGSAIKEGDIPTEKAVNQEIVRRVHIGIANAINMGAFLQTILGIKDEEFAGNVGYDAAFKISQILGEIVSQFQIKAGLVTKEQLDAYKCDPSLN